MTPRGPSSEMVSTVIGDMYDAAYDHTLWPIVIETLCGMFDGSKACLVRIGPNLQLSDAIAANTDPKYNEKYLDEFVDDTDALQKAVMAVPVGTVYSDHDLIGREKLRSTRFWNDWMAPQDMYGGLACKLLASGPSSWFFDVQRGRKQEEFDCGDRALFKFIAPHIRRSVELGRKIQTDRALATTFSRLPVGIILVDGRRRIININNAADAILCLPGVGLRSKFGYLVADKAATSATLTRLIENACSIQNGKAPGLGGDFMLKALSNEDQVPEIFSVSVGPLLRNRARGLPMEPCAVIALRKLAPDLPDGIENLLRDLFSLSPRQAETAVLLARGYTLKDAAAQQGIRFSTARSHLEAVFHKTGTHQQSQLVALLKTMHPLG